MDPDPYPGDPKHIRILWIKIRNTELLANVLKKSKHTVKKISDIDIAALSGAPSAWTSSSLIYRICRRPSGRDNCIFFAFPQH
jgi:hypothetical protein